MNTTNIIASGDSKSVKTKESSKATRSESLEDLQRQLETYEKRAEETLSGEMNSNFDEQLFLIFLCVCSRFS